MRYHLVSGSYLSNETRCKSFFFCDFFMMGTRCESMNRDVFLAKDYNIVLEKFKYI